MKSIYPDLNLLLDDLAAAYKKNLLEKLYEAGCRYVQFEGVKSILTDEAARLNNRVLRERPEGLFVAFHAATDMLIRLHGADAYFLNYDCGICDRSRLLWFVREREAVFGFVLSYYPDEEELDELQAKMEEVLNYIPVKHLTLCLPDADNLLNSSEEDEVKQWKTVELAKDMAARIFFCLNTSLSTHVAVSEYTGWVGGVDLRGCQSKAPALIFHNAGLCLYFIGFVLI